MSKKCPICGRGIGVYQDYVGGTSFFKCDICGHTGCDFEDMTVFDRITASPETLANEFVTEFTIYGGRSYWCSLLLAEKGHSVFEQRFNTKEEATAATVARLKEVKK